MIKKITVCALAMLFAALFLACSGPSPKERRVGLTAAILPAWDKAKDGILPNKEHPYGFDRHPDDKNELVHVSVPNGENGFVTLKMDYGSNKYFNFEYYVCDLASPYPYTLLGSIDKSKKEQKYTVTANGDSVKIGLCRISPAGTGIAQALQIHPYNWREYDFDVYILGDSNSTDDRHQLINRKAFWDSFDTVYAQAVARHRNVQKEFISSEKGYVLTRVAGKYGNGFMDNCAVGDIGRLVNSIDSSAEKGGQRRAIIQVGYPTKRFWPLKVNRNTGNIEICGEPELEYSRYYYGQYPIEPISKNCEVPKAFAFMSSVGWKLRYSDGTEAIADTNNVKPECAVFTENSTSDYVGEIPTGAGAAMLDKTHSSVVVLPWQGNMTKKVALHELGHTMGLDDLDDKPLSYIKRSMESNLMHYSAESEAYKLRKRGVKARYFEGKYEFQWDCLQKKNVDVNCLWPGNDPYYPYYTD
jgi:hypothetical protein